MSDPNVVASFCRMKCPACRKGNVFTNSGVFPLKQFLDIDDYCKCCGQKLVIESNNGGGINYALTIILFFLNIFWYWPIFGFSYKDDSFMQFLFSSIAVVLLAQPWLMRYSKIFFLYFIVKYKGMPEGK